MKISHFSFRTIALAGSLLVLAAAQSQGSCPPIIASLLPKNVSSELAQTKITPTREKLGIGEIVYVEYKSECPPEGPATTAARVGPMIVPNVKLKGVAWTDDANLQVTLEGRISVYLAKAAVAEVFANLQKADFSKVK